MILRAINFAAFLLACAGLWIFYFAWKAGGFTIDTRFIWMFGSLCGMAWTICNEAVLSARTQGA